MEIADWHIARNGSGMYGTFQVGQLLTASRSECDCTIFGRFAFVGFGSNVVVPSEVSCLLKESQVLCCSSLMKG
jgi:hypothetical protein